MVNRVVLCLAVLVAQAGMLNAADGTEKAFAFTWASPWSLMRLLLYVSGLFVLWLALFQGYFPSMLDPAKPANRCAMPRDAFRTVVCYYWLLAVVLFVILFSLMPKQELRVVADGIPGWGSLGALAQFWFVVLLGGVLGYFLLRLLLKPRRGALAQTGRAA